MTLISICNSFKNRRNNRIWFNKKSDLKRDVLMLKIPKIIEIDIQDFINKPFKEKTEKLEKILNFQNILIEEPKSKIELQGYNKVIEIDLQNSINDQCREETERLRKMLVENKLPDIEEWGGIIHNFLIGLASDTEVSKRTEVVELFRAALLNQKEAAYKQETNRLIKISEKELAPDFITQWRELKFLQIELTLYPEFGKNDTGISQAEIARRRAVEEVINKAIPSPFLLEYQYLLLSSSEPLVDEKVHKIIDQSQVDKVIKETLDNGSQINDMVEKQAEVFLQGVASDLTAE